MEIEVHNSKIDRNQSTSKVKANTSLWIPPSHHICLTFNTLVHIIVDSTRRSPFLCCHEKVKIREQDQKGCDWQLSKGKADGNVGAWMSCIPPDTG